MVSRSTSEHSNADGLSRLPAKKAGTPEESDIFHFTHVNDLPVTARDIGPLLNGVLNLLWNRTVFCGGCESLSPGHYRTKSL